MLQDFVVVLRDNYFDSLVESASIFIWLCSAVVSIYLWRGANSCLAKKFLLVVCIFCVSISVITISVFCAHKYSYYKWHFSDDPPLVHAGNVSKFRIPVYGIADDKDLATIKFALEFPEVDFVKPHSIRVFDKKSLVTILTFHDISEAHAHSQEKPTCQNICFKDKEINLRNLWHEMSHIDDSRLPLGAILDWVTISGYDDGFVHDSQIDIFDHSFPKNGLWTGYGATKYGEDMAEWRSRVYWCLYLDCEPQANPFNYINDRGDLRWAMKLGWMLQWKRITKYQYIKIKKMMVDMGFNFKP